MAYGIWQILTVFAIPHVLDMRQAVTTFLDVSNLYLKTRLCGSLWLHSVRSLLTPLPYFYTLLSLPPPTLVVWAFPTSAHNDLDD